MVEEGTGVVAYLKLIWWVIGLDCDETASLFLVGARACESGVYTSNGWLDSL